MQKMLVWGQEFTAMNLLAVTEIPDCIGGMVLFFGAFGCVTLGARPDADGRVTISFIDELFSAARRRATARPPPPS